MKQSSSHQSVSTKLTMWTLCFALLIFLVSAAFLYIQSIRLIRQECIERSVKILDNTVLKVRGYLDEVETASHNIYWLVSSNLQPDSLINFSRRVVQFNPNINGCSVSLEPGFFPLARYYFSAYTIREGDSLVSIVEEPYDYTQKEWYKEPRDKGTCWVEPYSDYNELSLYTSEIIASYGMPIYRRDSTFVGVLSTDVSLRFLTDVLSKEKPYPNSYIFMLGSKGNYLVHPDSVKLSGQTIFSASDPEVNSDIYALGHEMINGKKGNMRVNINNQYCLVFYCPVAETDWSLALVCPESDIFSDYNNLGYVIIVIIILGLIVITLVCRKIIDYFIKPVNVLAKHIRHISEGNFDEPMPISDRHDEVGQLQNSFSVMQQSIQQHVSHIQNVNEEMQQRNEELVRADQLAQESIRRKAAFIQDLTHQIRTPLNIILGFAQVMYSNNGQLSEEEKRQIMQSMQKSSASVSHMVEMLIDTSIFEKGQTASTDDDVNCNELARKAITEAKGVVSHRITPLFNSKLPDSFTLHTNEQYLLRVLRELVINALKFTHEGYVRMIVKSVGDYVCFIIEDTGRGIAEADRERIFAKFIKLDEFSEGLGIGLAISRRMTELIGGSLTLDSTYKKGCRFIVALPKR